MFFSAAVNLWLQTIIHLVLILLTAYSLRRRSPDEYGQVLRPKVWLCWLGVLAALAFSTYRSGSLARSEQELWLWFDYFLIFILASELPDKERIFLTRGLFFSWLALAAWGLTQFFALRQPPRAGLVNPNELGSYLIIPICLGLEKRLYFPFLAAALATLLFTRSAAALIGLGAALGYLGWKGQNLQEAQRRLLVVGGFLCAVPFLAKAVSSWDQHRWLWWKSALEMLQLHPFLGLGPGTFEMGMHRRPDLDLYSMFAHNTYLQWGAENGLLGLGLILLLACFCLYRQANVYIRAASLGLLAHNAFDFSLILPSHALLFWTVLGFRNNNVKESRRLSAPLRLVFTLSLVSLAWMAINRFKANRAFAQGLYWMTEGHLQQAKEKAYGAISLHGESADPFMLLARASSDAHRLTHRRGALLECAAYTLGGIEREPLRPLFWQSAMAVYEALGWRDGRDRLKQSLFETYPHFQNDKRFQK